MLKAKNHDGIVCCHGITGFSVTRMHIHFYLADDLLIDTGSARLGKQSAGFFRNNTIRRAALTHVHEDHCGMASWLSRNMNARIYLDSRDHEEAVVPSRLPFYRKLAWKDRPGFDAEPMPDHLETERCNLDVIATPGHYPHHVVFHEKTKGWIFTGDLYIAPRQMVAFKTENTRDAIASITHLLNLDWDTLFCAHAGVQANGREKLTAKLDYLESIRSQTKALLAEGIGFEEISRRLFPKKHFWEVVSQGEWSAYRLVSTAV